MDFKDFNCKVFEFWLGPFSDLLSGPFSDLFGGVNGGVPGGVLEVSMRGVLGGVLGGVPEVRSRCSRGPLEVFRDF